MKSSITISKQNFTFITKHRPLTKSVVFYIFRKKRGKTMGIIKEAAKDAFKKSFGTINISFKWVKNGIARLAYVSAWMLTLASLTTTFIAPLLIIVKHNCSVTSICVSLIVGVVGVIITYYLFSFSDKFEMNITKRLK